MQTAAPNRQPRRCAQNLPNALFASLRHYSRTRSRRQNRPTTVRSRKQVFAGRAQQLDVRIVETNPEFVLLSTCQPQRGEIR